CASSRCRLAIRCACPGRWVGAGHPRDGSTWVDIRGDADDLRATRPHRDCPERDRLDPPGPGGRHARARALGDLAALLEQAGATASDEPASLDDGLTTDKDVPYGARRLQAFEWRVVARVVQVAGADGPARRRVEDDQIGIAADLERALVREAKTPRWGGRKQVDHPLQGQASARDALRVQDGEQGLDPGGAIA